MLGVIVQEEPIDNFILVQDEVIVNVYNLLALEDGSLLALEDGSVVNLNKSYHNDRNN